MNLTDFLITSVASAFKDTAAAATVTTSSTSTSQQQQQRQQETFRRTLSTRPELSAALRDADVETLQETLAKVISELGARQQQQQQPQNSSSSSSFGIFAAADHDADKSRFSSSDWQEMEKVCAALILAAMRRKQQQLQRAAIPQIIHSPVAPPTQPAIKTVHFNTEQQRAAESLSPVSLISASSPDQEQEQQHQQLQQLAPFPELPEHLASPRAEMNPFPPVNDIAAAAAAPSSSSEQQQRQPPAASTPRRRAWNFEKQQQEEQQGEPRPRIVLFHDTPTERSGELIGASTPISVIGAEALAAGTATATAGRQMGETAHIIPQPSPRSEAISAHEDDFEDAMKFIAEEVAVRRHQSSVSRSRRSWVHQRAPQPPAFEAAETATTTPTNNNNDNSILSPISSPTSSPDSHQRHQALPAAGRQENHAEIVQRCFLHWFQRTAWRRCVREFILLRCLRRWKRAFELSQLLKLYSSGVFFMQQRGSNNSNTSLPLSNNASGLVDSSVNTSTSSLTTTTTNPRRPPHRSPHQHFLLRQAFRQWRQRFQCELLIAQRCVRTASHSIVLWRQRTQELQLVRAFVAMRAFNLVSTFFRAWRMKQQLRLQDRMLETHTRAALLLRHSFSRWRRKQLELSRIRHVRERLQVVPLKRHCMEKWLLAVHHSQATKFVALKRQRNFTRQVFGWWLCRMRERQSKVARIIAGFKTETIPRVVMRGVFVRWARVTAARRFERERDAAVLRALLGRWRERALLKRHLHLQQQRVSTTSARRFLLLKVPH